MSQKPHLIYLGLSGFPLGLAPIQRQKLIGKALIDSNWEVSVICTRGIHTMESYVQPNGYYQGIYYEYVTGAVRKNSFLLRNYYKFIAPIKEFIVIARLKKEKGITAAIITDRNLLWDAIKYRFFSYILGFKIYLNLVELYKDRPNTSFFMRINDVFFNLIGLNFYDGVLPISGYINKYITRFNKKSLLVPILTDTAVFNELKGDKNESVVYCGSAAYKEAIRLILDTFKLVKNKTIKLILVIGGSDNQLSEIRNRINKLGIADRVELKRNIPDFELFYLYAFSRALLLPLFNTIQDNARFPHKFGEYLASGTVVITNKIGEIATYLNHLDNVIFASNNNPAEIAYWIDWVIENKISAEEIGKKGRMIAKEYFDYRLYSVQLSNFLSSGIN